MIETLLQLSEFDAGMVRIVPQPCDVSTLIDRVFSQLHYNSAIKQVALNAAIDRPLPKVSLDPARFEQVLTNVVSNAIRFSPPGSTVVVAATVSDDSLVIDVADSGTGIAPEALPHIFERFYRVGSGEAGRHRTGGLGLSIAKSIVELHGGMIAAQSTLHMGTTVTIRLPLHGQSRADGDAPAAHPLQS